jgi:hypothetical protein
MLVTRLLAAAQPPRLLMHGASTLVPIRRRVAVHGLALALALYDPQEKMALPGRRGSAEIKENQVC